MKHRRLSWLVGLATTLAVIGGTIAPAQAAPVAKGVGGYAAVGDSFAAGWGAGGGSNELGQNSNAYPVLLAKTAQFTFTALPHGVTTSTVLAQVASIPSNATQVTLTVGGNDLAFVPTVTQCLLAPEACDLTPALQGLKTVHSGLPKVLDAIHKQAPNAKIYVTGYPLLFQAKGRTCALGLTSLPSSVTHKMDAVTLALNLTILSTTLGKARSYTKYVDVTARYLGHGVCGATAPNPRTWLNPVLPPEPGQRDVTWLHPNAQGQQAYASALRAAGFKVPAQAQG